MSMLMDRALVLRLTEYSETSQIATLLTERSGLVRALAKGARRSTKTRVSVGLDLLELGDVSIAMPRGDSSLATLTEWVQRDGMLAVRRSLPATMAGLYAAECAWMLMQEHDPHPRVFGGLLDLLNQLSTLETSGDETNGAMSLLVRFQAALLKDVGFAPELRRCACCGASRKRGAQAIFSSTAGGYVCPSCAASVTEKQPISAELLDGARGTTDPVEWFGLLDYHVSCIAGRAPRCGSALRSVLGG